MTRHFAISCALALAFLSCLSAGAHAGPLTFTYDWSQTTSSVSSDHALNAIDFSAQGPLTISLPAAVGNVASLSIQNSTSDTWTSAPFSLTVKITDGSNTGTLGFNGLMNASVTGGTATAFALSYSNPTTQSLTLGTDQFQVSITGYTPPSPSSGDYNPGCIGYMITATPGDGGAPNPTPEPTSLLLSYIGVGAFGLRAWRNRQNAGTQLVG